MKNQKEMDKKNDKKMDLGVLGYGSWSGWS